MVLRGEPCGRKPHRLPRAPPVAVSDDRAWQLGVESEHVNAELRIRLCSFSILAGLHEHRLQLIVAPEDGVREAQRGC